MSATIVSDQVESRAVQDENFLRHVLPSVTSLSRRTFRRLPPSEHEEALAAATALGWIMFAALISRGKDPAKFPKRFAVVVVARISEGRMVGSPTNVHDVLSRAAQARHSHTVERLTGRCENSGSQWEEILVENPRTGPAETAAARLDLREWFHRMPSRRRQIAERLAEGHLTIDVARQFRLSSGRVSQLRGEFRKSWEAFQGQ